MNLDDLFNYLRKRTPLEQMPINWDSRAYTSGDFNEWATGPKFKGWAGNKETEEEASVIVRLLKVKPGNAVLDVACGYGRHALALAEKHGLNVTGIDISPGLITAARRLAGEKGLDIKYEVSNATDISWKNEFNGALIAFNSFSLFSPEDAPEVLRRIHAALKPGGWLFMDLDNKPYNCRYGKRDTHWYQYPSDLVLQEIFFHGDTSVESCREINLKKDSEEVGEFILFKKIYSSDEIKSLLTDCGFRAGRVYGDWDLSRLTDKSPKMILAGVSIKGV